MTAQLLRDRYRLEDVVGSGAQGQVWRALDVRHDRTVAIKTREGSSPEILAEARVLYGLRPHGSLPLLRDDFTEEGRLYLVMDWVRGSGLDRIVAAGALDLNKTVEYLRPVAEALDHMHAHVPPIAHGDVKPANILSDASGRVVLVDLGLSGRSGAGSPGFRAPETSTEPAGPASDVYSLAATAYALLTGHAPGRGGFAAMPNVPADRTERVRRILEWGLQVAPGRRPRSAGRLLDALAGVATSFDLPNQRTSFIGRLEELAQLDDLLRTRRLVTIVGPGGAGKTRLAVEAAARFGAAAGGAVFVDLLQDASGVAHAVLRAIGQRDPGGNLEETMARHLSRQPCLLVIDNAERLVEETAEACGLIAERCPAVRILVTSRTPLGVVGESFVRITGLPTEEQAGTSVAASLLLTRMRESLPAFEPTDEDREAALAIAARLEGLPLALELAAARAAHAGLSAVSGGISERLDSLGSLRGVPERHQSLGAMVDYSYEAFDPETQRVLRAASILVGGADPVVVAVVAGCDESLAGASLSRAADASLIERLGDRRRFLEPVRQRLEDHLIANGERENCRSRLAAWASEFFVDAARTLDQRHDEDKLGFFEREEANLLEGFHALLDEGADEKAFAGLAACLESASRRNDLILNLEDARRQTERNGLTLPLRALALLGQTMALQRLLAQARPLLDTVIAKATETNDVPAAVTALIGRATASLGGHRLSALHDCETAERLLASAPLDEPALHAYLMVTRGKVLMELGRLDDARRQFESAVRFASAHGLTGIHGHALMHRVIIESNAGDEEASRMYLDRLFAYGERFNSPGRLGEAWNALGHWHLNRGETDEAEAAYRRANEVWDSVKDRRADDVAQINIGQACLSRGAPTEAERHLRLAHATSITRGDDEFAAFAGFVLADAVRQQGRLSEARVLAEEAAETLRYSGHTIAYARALRVLAQIALAEGRTDDARDLAGKARDLHLRVGKPADVASLDQFLSGIRT